MGEPGECSMTLHDFATSLAVSHEYADAPWWGEVYRRAFPTMKAMVCVRDDGWAQRGGIDRMLVLSSGRTISVDEKVRERDYGDILLEVYSDRDKKVLGWGVKPLACDFIAYAIAPICTCWLLPTLTLQAALKKNGRDWYGRARARSNGFRVVDADNGRYVTQSLAIPRDELLSAMTDAMTVGWGDA